MLNQYMKSCPAYRLCNKKGCTGYICVRIVEGVVFEDCPKHVKTKKRRK